MARSVRYRPTFPQAFFLPAFSSLAGVLVATAAVALTGSSIGWHLFGQGVLCATLVGLLCLVSSLFEGIELRDSEIVVRGIRRRRVAREQVTEIQVERLLGDRRILVRHDGRTTRFRAPTSFLDRRFDEKYRTIAAWAGPLPDQRN